MRFFAVLLSLSLIVLNLPLPGTLLCFDLESVQQLRYSAQAAQDNTPKNQHSLRVVILPFHNITGKTEDNWLSESFAESLTMGLVQVEALHVIERSQIQQLLKEQQFGQTGFVDENAAPRLGRLLGAEVVVLGSYQKVGQQLQANVRFVNVETGQIDRKRTAQVEGPFEQIFGLQKDLAHTLILNFNVATKPNEIKEMERILEATDSPEAHKFYILGTQKLREGLKPEETIQDFKAALDLDPNYALAHAGLAEIYARQAREHMQLIILPPTQGFSIQEVSKEQLAQEHADQALALNPKLSQVWRALAWLESAKNNHQHALELSRKAVEMNPRDADSLMTYLTFRFEKSSQSLDIAVMRKELEQLGANLNDPWLKFSIASLALGQEMFKTQPDLGWIETMLLEAQTEIETYPYVPILLAGISLRKGNIKEAETRLQQAEKLAQDIPEVLGVLASMYSGLKQNDKAMELVERALKIKADTTSVLIFKAEILFAQGQFTEAEQIYNALEQKLPQSTWLAFSRGTHYLVSGKDYALARDYLEKALKYWEKDPNGLGRMMLVNLLASAYVVNQENTKALPLYEEMRNDPVYYGQAYEMLARLYELEERFDEALEAYTAYLTVHPEVRDKTEVQQAYKWYYLRQKNAQEPENIAVLNDLGQLAILNEKYTLAQKYLQTALKLDNRNAVVQHNLGYLHLKQAQWSEALGYLQQATQIKPDYIKAWYNLALVYQELKQTEQAKSALRRVLELDSTHAEAKKRLQDWL